MLYNIPKILCFFVFAESASGNGITTISKYAPSNFSFKDIAITRAVSLNLIKRTLTRQAMARIQAFPIWIIIAKQDLNSY